MTLTDIIKQKIQKNGAISFRDFMAMALYYPDLGYYTSPKEKIGRHGDFYTSSSLTPAFGVMIAKQLEEMFCSLDEKKFTIVEFGAGTGLLCNDILNHLEQNKNLYDKLNYFIIEKSPWLRKKAEPLLPAKVKYLDSICELDGIDGCVISNELVDNFPVHQVVMKNELFEVFVDYQNGFVELLKPASEEIKEYINELQINLPAGYRTEINLEVKHWMKDISSALNKGYVMTIDYGYPSGELYCDSRSNGTLACYHKHSVNFCPYEAIGEQDITSHANFSAPCHWGFKNGLEYCGFRDQGPFLLALGFKEYLKELRKQKTDVFRYEKDNLLSHILLEDMGHKYKVLVQQKKVPMRELSGFRV